MDILRQWREANGHSQQRLADAVERHPTAISKIENRENLLDLDTFYRLIRYTGLDPMAALEDIFESKQSAQPESSGRLRVARRKRARVKRHSAVRDNGDGGYT
jgi:transcriptional regulator with XRE-family HTH domain